MEIFKYDIMQTEIVELTCILEKILRDFYMDIAHIVYKTNQIEYIERLIEKSTNNDFMHFDKADLIILITFHHNNLIILLPSWFVQLDLHKRIW